MVQRNSRTDQFLVIDEGYDLWTSNIGYKRKTNEIIIKENYTKNYPRINYRQNIALSEPDDTLVSIDVGHIGKVSKLVGSSDPEELIYIAIFASGKIISISNRKPSDSLLMKKMRLKARKAKKFQFDNNHECSNIIEYRAKYPIVDAAFTKYNCALVLQLDNGQHSVNAQHPNKFKIKKIFKEEKVKKIIY